MAEKKDKRQLKIAKYFKKIKIKNYRFKFRHLIILVAFSMIAMFLGYIFKTAVLDAGKPQFGDRCLGLPIEVDTTTLKDFNEGFIAEYERVDSVSITKQCRQLKIIIRMNDVTNIEDAQNHVIAYTHLLDEELGLAKAEGEPFSTLLAIDGYELNYLVTSQAENFPLFAVKLPGHNDISWQSNEVTNQAVVDELTSQDQDSNVEGQNETEE